MAVGEDSKKEEKILKLNKMSEQILAERDRFIASRINSSLQAGETGILFLGMLHNVERFLEKDIKVTYPLYKPAVRRDEK